ITDMTLPLGEEPRRDIAEDTPLCRNGRPEDVAAAILWLSSESASFVTGQTVGVDGGWRG
ncbi:MAG: SDR family oxidoreductase, partial [Clostridia bacterium]|nr:SDR family oxidoreductase [Clostridia bacterium]